MANKSVESLLADIRLLGAEQYAIVQRVRQLGNEQITPLSEEVKYGGILFGADVMFAGVFAYKKHVSVEFSHGAQIEDSFGFLEGSGKARRHIKLFSLADIEAKQLAHYLPLALAAARAAV